MADYYSILNKTISGLAKNTPDVRQAVYVKARTAIEAQLRRLEPPPDEAAIAGQLDLLEEAILVIESEYSPEQVMQELDEIIELEEPKTVDVIAPPPETLEEEVPVVAPVDTEVPVEEASIVDPATDEPATVEPAVVEETAVEPVEAPDAAVQLAGDGPVEPQKKPRRIIKILAYLIIFSVIGGAAYGLWLNRSALEPLIASVIGGTSEGEDAAPSEAENTTAEADASVSEEQEEPDSGASEAEKEPVRLGADGEDLAAEEPEQTDGGLEPTEVPVVLEPAEEPEGEQLAEPEVNPVEEEPDAVTGAEQEEQQASSALGEVAYLYEEGSAGSGATRSSATVSWSVARVKPSDTLPPEPVIVGNMEVPDKNLSIAVNIKRNVDPALSASHIIELSFEIPDGFVGGGIDNVARFVLKPTEEARGEPLVAVPVKVSDGYFLIALDNLDQAVEVNQQLLLNSGWVDIPIAYSTGKRALLTLEKGGSGEQVFKEAFDDWKNR